MRRIWEKLARKYDRDIRFFEKVGLSGGRQWVCSQAEGDVLEIGIGTGRNLEHYPEGIRLIGIDLSASMVEIAKQRAKALSLSVDLRLGDAQALEFPDASFDTVVCTLALCSIPDDRSAVSEAKRVLRPRGRFLLLEHVRSPIGPVRSIQRILDWFAVRIEGDHLVREPLVHLEAEGFAVERLERLKLGLVERVAARKPNAA